MIRYLLHIIAYAIIIAGLAACSTTKKLGEDEVLYTGVNHFKVNSPENEKLPSAVKSQIFNVINVKPNNPLYSPYVRTPFPIGLWVYNNMTVTSDKGFKHWFYNKFAADPVLVSNVRPELRVEMIKDILHNNGYFNSTATYQLEFDKRNHKKARINYTVDTETPYTLSSVELINKNSELTHIIDSLARKSNYLKPGKQYFVDSLNAVRTNITNVLRNKGYYFFRPEYIEYLADSTITRGEIALRMVLASNIPPAAISKYRTGNITTYIYRNEGGGIPDTIQTKRGTIILMQPAHLRKGLIPSCITFKKGKIFSVRDMNRTQSYLSRLGIFNAIDINVTPMDSLKGSNLLDVYINCTFDSPLEATFEVNASSKSNSYIGPGLSLGLTHKNIFGGGEQLSAAFTATYEWQTGKSSGNNSAFNSYEFGLNTTLAFPRLLAPKFIQRSKRNLNWTRISLGGNILNRPHYFKMVQFSTGFGYQWHTNPKSLHDLTLFKLTYTKLLKTTAEFDSIMKENPAVALSFRNQFIPQLSYTYSYTSSFGEHRENNIVWQTTLTEAGNIFAGIWSLAGVKGEKKLFGSPFSQFIKGQTQLVYSRRLVGKNYIVSRVMVGAAHAYGNSQEVPYSEQFYIGGANSIRAFTVRSIGPGSYHPAKNNLNGYYDQTGTFKFEMNVEYRFPLFWLLHGAVFVDTGNIWLLKKDESRPGGELNGRTFFKDLALGTGIGIRFDMDMLVIRGDLGIGIHAPYDTGKSGYYNMTSFKDSLAFHLAIGYPF